MGLGGTAGDPRFLGGGLPAASAVDGSVVEGRAGELGGVDMSSLTAAGSVVVSCDGTDSGLKSAAGSKSAPFTGTMLTTALAGVAPLWRFDMLNGYEKLLSLQYECQLCSLSQNSCRDNAWMLHA